MHVHEHREEELDAVGLGSRPEISVDIRHALTPSYSRGKPANSGSSPQVNVV